MEFWNDYYQSERFRNELESLPEHFPCAGECSHTKVPPELRVLMDDNAETRSRVERLLSPELRCTWFGLSLISMTLHSHFGEQYGDWSDKKFCPVPVANVGFGCVHGVLPFWIVTRLPFPADKQETFPLFFEQTLLGEAAQITSIPKKNIEAKMLADRDLQKINIPKIAVEILHVLTRPCQEDLR